MKIIVLGSRGHVGSAVCKALHARGHETLGPSKHLWNVDRPVSFTAASNFVGAAADALIYCVGHCPADGFVDAVKRPLSDYPLTSFDDEIGMHVRGPFNTFSGCWQMLKPGGHMVFVSSAAVRLLDMPLEKRPPIHIYHHLAVIAAQNALIEGMRMDPLVAERDLKIHKVSPAAISDSPFHNVEGGPQSPMTVKTEVVVQAILGCLSAEIHQDIKP